MKNKKRKEQMYGETLLPQSLLAEKVPQFGRFYCWTLQWPGYLSYFKISLFGQRI